MQVGVKRAFRATRTSSASDLSDLHNTVQVTHVDAKLEGRRRHDDAVPSLPEGSLCAPAFVEGERRVRHVRFDLPLPQLNSQFFDGAARVGEDEALLAAGAVGFRGKPFARELLGAGMRVAERVLRLKAKVRQLEGLLPVCSYCKKIRDEADRWTMMEEYVMKHSAASFSHSVCPDCYAEHIRPQLSRLDEPRGHEKTGT